MPQGLKISGYIFIFIFIKSIRFVGPYSASIIFVFIISVVIAIFISLCTMMIMMIIIIIVRLIIVILTRFYGMETFIVSSLFF